MSSRNVHSAEDREAWIGIQKKTFTRWANQYLPAGSKIEDLSTDLGSGVMLGELLNRISNESVGRINKNPKMEIQRLENVNLCLNFIKNHDIPLVNIGSSDIVHGNEKLILGLLWTIILRFEVAGADGKAGLLLWLQRSTKGYAGVDVKDFTSSWKDGLAFNALIHRYRPDLLNYDELSGDDALGNCEKAFSIAEQSLGIARLLDPEDVVAQPDEKSQVAYLSQFFKLFAGQAKLESKLKAIRNAVEVTRRHDEWIDQYKSGSTTVMEFVQEKKGQLEVDGTESTTEEVKQALDAFSSYMKETKPQMAAKRAETEGLYTTLVASKRNNNRPEFTPEVVVASINASFEDLERLEQAYERKMLDRYLAFQRADHAVSKFNAKSATVNTWCDEKSAVFAAGEVGTSVPEIEAHLEMHAGYENRLGLYEKVMSDLEQIVNKASIVSGHAGVAQVQADMQALQEKMSAVKSQGNDHRSKLAAALEAEKALVQKEKDYLRQIDQVDFTIDQLEERVNEEIHGATAAEMQEIQANVGSFQADVDQVSGQLNDLTALAQEIVSKRPDAAGHCDQQRARLDQLTSKMGERQATIQQLLDAESLKDELSKKFAELAGTFVEYINTQRAAIASLSGSLESQKEALAQLRDATSGEGSAGASQLQALNEVSQQCDDAQVVANPYTSDTIYSLRAQYEQLGKAIKRADDALSAQLMAQKSLEIPPEQLKEIQEIFRVFDTDQDGKLRLSDLREACLGAGMDLDDEELEKRMKARSSNMMFTIDDFIAFFLEEVQSGDSKDDVVSAFKAISGDGKISPEQIQKTFASISPDLATYLEQNIPDGDYQAFTEQLFTR